MKFRGDRIVIPYSTRKEILEKIHDGHMGISKCRERANQGILKQPLLPSPLPARPFQKVAADLCEIKGKHYLVRVNYYSRWIDLSALHMLTSEAVIAKLKDNFAIHGIPHTLVSDNGPQFSSGKFKQFAKDWNFTHVTTSPYYPQANGEAERAVKTAKEILQQEDKALALLTYRAIPVHATGVSPTELALGRKIRITLPTLPKTLTPCTVSHSKIEQRDCL